jgi:hypothetical protein
MSNEIVALAQLNDLLTKTGNSTDAAGAATLFAQLNRIAGFTDQVEGYTDTVETLLGLTGDVASGTGTIMARLAQLIAYTDTLEATEAAIKAKTDLIGAAADASGTATMFARLAAIAVDLENFVIPRIGTSGDAASMASTVFAALKSIYNSAPPIVGRPRSVTANCGVNNAFATILDISGAPGRIEQVVLGAINSSLGTIRITIDGVVETLGGVSPASNVNYLVAPAAAGVTADSIYFNNSLKVEASSNTGSINGCTVAYRLKLGTP